MTLPSNPNGITNLPDIRDRAPTLTPAAGELGCTNFPGTRAAKEFIQACDGCDRDEIKKKPGKIELCRCRRCRWSGELGCYRGAEPRRTGPTFRLAKPATATKFKKWPEKSNNVAVATVASVATAANSLDDLLRRPRRAQDDTTTHGSVPEPLCAPLRPCGMKRWAHRAAARRLHALLSPVPQLYRSADPFPPRPLSTASLSTTVPAVGLRSDRRCYRCRAG